MQVHVFDFRWKDPTLCEIQASINGKFAKKEITIGQNLSAEIVSDVSCAGYMKEEKWNPCPQNAIGKIKCEICRAREGSFIFTAFDGFNQENITPQDLAQISGEHYVYLALFDRNLIKIGVSKSERKQMRQLEQGSHFTLFIAKTPDGVSARQIESLFRKSGMTDKIKPSQKKNFLCPEILPGEGEKILRELLNAHSQALSEYPHLQNFLCKSPEFCAWEAVYNLNNIAQNPHFIELEKEEWLSGKILAIKGQFMILETPGEVISICMKNLFGRTVEFEEKPSGLKKNAAFQGTLF